MSRTLSEILDRATADIQRRERLRELGEQAERRISQIVRETGASRPESGLDRPRRSASEQTGE